MQEHAQAISDTRARAHAPNDTIIIIIVRMHVRGAGCKSIFASGVGIGKWPEMRMQLRQLVQLLMHSQFLINASQFAYALLW